MNARRRFVAACALLALAACRQPAEEKSGAFSQFPGALNGVVVTNTPDAGQVLTAVDTVTAAWQASVGGGGGGAPSGPAGGDLAGTYPNPSTAKLNGASVGAAGALVTGNSPYVSGVSALTYSALNLAGGSGWVSGLLPDANQAAQTIAGDVTGNTGASVVAKVNGTAYGAGGALVTGSVPRATGASSVAYGALDLANASAVTGLLPTGNMATITSVNAVTMPAGGALATGAVLRATGAGAALYGAVDLTSANAVSGALPVANQAAQSLSGDATGTTAASVVSKVNGASYPAAGALTTGTIPRVTGVSTVAYGALDLANASAVTGVLPTANMAAATAGATGSIQLAGNLGGTAASPTVVGLTFGSDAQGDVAYRGASAWVRLGAGTTGQVLTTAGAAANPTWSTNFQANNLITTGAYSSGATPSTATANFLVPNNTTIISYRNAANSANVIAMVTDAANNLNVGDSSNTANSGLRASTTVALNAAGGNQVIASSGSVVFAAPLSFSSATSSPTLVQSSSATNAATGQTLAVTAQSMTGTTSTGGDLRIGGGTGTSANGAIDLRNCVTTTSAPAAGGAGALPATPAGYVTIKVGGTSRLIPYY